MNTVVCIGDTHEMEGFALAGVHIIRAGTDVEFSRAWADLDDAVGLVILSAAAAQQLEAEIRRRPEVLTVVMP